jgi:signal transduction histidine kinase
MSAVDQLQAELARLRLFGGSLDSKSQAGKGTCVTVTIPLTITEGTT